MMNIGSTLFCKSIHTLTFSCGKMAIFMQARKKKGRDETHTSFLASNSFDIKSMPINSNTAIYIKIYTTLVLLKSVCRFKRIQDINPKFWLMSGSSHIQSVLIGVEYRNCHQTLDVYLLFAILLGQMKSKVNYRLVTYKLASL